MKTYIEMIKNPLFATITIIIVGLASCEMDSSIKNDNNLSEFIIDEFETSDKPDHQIIDEIKKQLLKNGIDTILYYKRTSIG